MSFGNLMIHPTNPKRGILELYYWIFGIPLLNMHLRWRAVKEVFRQVKCPVLDVGCGNGAFTIEATKITKGYVVGFDINRGDIHFANKLTREKGIEHVDFLVADARQMPFRKETFGSIACLEVLEHINEDDLVLAESSRVLNKKGLMVITSVLPGYTLYTSLPIFCDKIGEEDFFRKMDHVRDGYSLESIKNKMSNVGLTTIKHKSFVKFFGAIGVKFIDFLLYYRTPLGGLSRHIGMLIFPLFLILSKLDDFLPIKGKELMVLASVPA